MEKQRKIMDYLEQIPQPAFLAKEDRICLANQAAAALLLVPGTALSPLLLTGAEEFAALKDGQLCLTLSLAGHAHGATVFPGEAGFLFLLDREENAEGSRSMALVSMELREPLMQALHNTRQMETDDPAAGKIHQNLMRILRMVCNMSDFGRYAASARMEVRDVDSFLLEIFQKAASLTEGTAELTYEGLGQPLFLSLDPEQLERAVWNILSNCIKYADRGSRIHAALTRRGQMLRLTVHNTGSTIPEAVQATLFRRYLRQPGIEDSRFGLGLGLAIVRTVAANHGGTVLIRSTPGGGTSVTMTLAIRQKSDPVLHCPILRPDYTGGWDHALVELSDCLGSAFYER